MLYISVMKLISEFFLKFSAKFVISGISTHKWQKLKKFFTDSNTQHKILLYRGGKIHICLHKKIVQIMSNTPNNLSNQKCFTIIINLFTILYIIISEKDAMPKPLTEFHVGIKKIQQYYQFSNLRTAHLIITYR